MSTGHVLLGILDVEGTAGQVLRGLGVDVPALPAALEATARTRGGAAATAVPASQAAPATTPVEEPDAALGPCCSGCGAELAGVLAYRTIAAAGPEGQRHFIVLYCGACGTAVGPTA